MNIKIQDLMVKNVVTSFPHKTVGHLKSIMKRNKIKSVPIVNGEDELKGIVTTTDLLGKDDNTPVSSYMTTDLFTIPIYSNVSLAAKMMRKRKIHHLLVTNEKKLVGILSSYDLLQLLESKRFVLKNPPTKNSKKRSKRGI